MKLIASILILVYIFYMQCELCYGKKFTRCGFRDELIRMKFKTEFIPSWVCLVACESCFDTKATGVGPSGSKKFGIFQINNLDYCKNGQKGGLCNIKCEDLLDDNIVDDAQCAQIIFDHYGFKAWAGWNRTCKQPVSQLANIVVDCPQSHLVKRNPTEDLIEEHRRNWTLYGNACNLINGCNFRTRSVRGPRTKRFFNKISKTSNKHRHEPEIDNVCQSCPLRR